MESSSILWDNVKSLPFPADILPQIELNENSDTQIWSMVGAPVAGATYHCVDGKKLYLQTLPNGEVSVKEQDFTGEILFGAYLLGKKSEDYNYFFCFKALFFKGMVMEVQISQNEKQSKIDFQTNMREINTRVMKTIKREASLWFKYLYVPYRGVMRFFMFCVSFVLAFIYDLIVFLVRKMTPL